ncbi:hypothetical protein [Limosilactobacillus mucosae]|uniref:hypothetical protein n=1 Tax=Limosilactobacillus mucosae TaxID=97478 RepID=UPI003995488B
MGTIKLRFRRNATLWGNDLLGEMLLFGATIYLNSGTLIIPSVHKNIGKTPCLVWQGVFKLQCRLKSAIIMA